MSNAAAPVDSLAHKEGREAAAERSIYEMIKEKQLQKNFQIYYYGLKRLHPKATDTQIFEMITKFFKNRFDGGKRRSHRQPRKTHRKRRHTSLKRK